MLDDCLGYNYPLLESGLSSSFIAFEKLRMIFDFRLHPTTRRLERKDIFSRRNSGCRWKIADSKVTNEEQCENMEVVPAHLSISRISSNLVTLPSEGRITAVLLWIVAIFMVVAKKKSKDSKAWHIHGVLRWNSNHYVTRMSFKLMSSLVFGPEMSKT